MAWDHGPQGAMQPASIHQAGQAQPSACQYVPHALALTKTRSTYVKQMKEHEDQLKTLAEFEVILEQVSSLWCA